MVKYDETPILRGAPGSTSIVDFWWTWAESHRLSTDRNRSFSLSASCCLMQIERNKRSSVKRVTFRGVPL